jgi:hypothetical protein
MQAGALKLPCLYPAAVRQNRYAEAPASRRARWWARKGPGATQPGATADADLSDKVKLSRYTPWRRMGERRYSSYSYLTSALDGGEWSASRPGRTLPPGKGPPGTHCTGGWVGPRAGLDAKTRRKILCFCRGSNPGCPVRSQSQN